MINDSKDLQSRDSKAKAIVVIPARGGSKRFPRKNIVELLGHPLLAYSITAAKKSSLVDLVYVSTEDEEIAEVAMSYHAEVPFLRPKELAGDKVTADSAVADMVQRIKEKQDIEIDIVVLIQPTSPFVTPSHIDDAVKMLRTHSDLDSVTTMTELDHRHHPYNLALSKTSDRWEFIFAEEREVARSRQSKPKALKFGHLFAARTETMLTKGRFGDKKGAVMIDSLYAWDIDYEWELDVTEMLLKKGKINLPHMADLLPLN